MAKKNKLALPKRVAGVKIPKKLRRSQMGQLMASPVAIAVLADAIVEFGEHLLRSDSRAGATARSALHHPAKTAKRATDRLAYNALTMAFTAAAQAFTQTLKEHRAEREMAGSYDETDTANYGTDDDLNTPAQRSFDEMERRPH